MEPPVGKAEAGLRRFSGRRTLALARCFIEVPPELHARQKHADILPLYQMIAKNVGIRRARGSFILATNIDILFSDEFFQWLREGALRPGKMYRLDRYDVASDVPVDTTVGTPGILPKPFAAREHPRWDVRSGARRAA